MNSTEYQVQQLQLRVRELETRMLQLEDRVVFNPPAQQEPVAYMSQNNDFYIPDDIVCVSKSKILTPLYTRPQAREWVGLTEDEQDELVYSEYDQRTRMELAIGIEAKLKEKNNGN